MKTLEDALSVAAGIEPDTYNIGDDLVYIAADSGTVTIDGTTTVKTLRRIADHLDPQPDSSPVIPEGWRPINERGGETEEVFLGRTKLGEYFVFIWDGEEFILVGTRKYVSPDEFIALSAIGTGRTEAEVRAEARREALEEAAELARVVKAGVREYVSSDHSSGCDSACDAFAATIRALIEKEPTA